MAKVIAIANQKGGVSKTTTTLNLGVGLAKKGRRVLLIDADAQGSLTTSLGYEDPDEMEVTLPTIIDKIANEEDFDKDFGLLEHKEGIKLLPCNIDLSVTEVKLTSMMSREYILKEYIEKVREDYDYILIDCSPSLGVVTVNALTASDSVIIPIQATYLPLKGLQQLIKSISMTKRYTNKYLNIDGILISMLDSRTNFSKDIISTLEESYGTAIRIFDTKIPQSIRAAECSAEGVSIFSYDPKSKLGKAYADLVEEVLNV